MAPLSLFSCSVCDDEFASVSTLHYHQMCLHTTEELSLAILSIRELPVNASPVGDSGNSISPSTDCEDKLLRNGLAKYPRFLNSGGSRKSKIMKSDYKYGSTDGVSDTPRNFVIDKENIVQNNAVGKNAGIGSDCRESAEVNTEKNNSLCKDRGESVKSSLYGAIKTLDGKAVDTPVIKIDKKSSNYRLTKHTLPNTDRTDCTEKSESFPDTVNNASSECQDTDSPSEKEVLEKHLKLMNMSSFDDCIELECSDDSDEDAERITTDLSCDEAKTCNAIEEKNGAQNQELIANECPNSESVSSKQVPDKSKAIKNKRMKSKIQKHKSWYKGSKFQRPGSKVPQGSISILKRSKKSVEDKEQLLEGFNTQPDKEKASEITPDSKNLLKIFTDSFVQTDESIFEEVCNGVVKMKQDEDNDIKDSSIKHSDDQLGDVSTIDGKVNDDKVSNDETKVSPKKISPKKKHILSIPEKNSKDKFIKFSSQAVKDELLLNDAQQNKPEVVILNGEKRFFCDDCAKTYKKRSHLDRHKRVHTGERPFMCSYCDKRFSVRSILNQHIRIHTGEKPYSCTICAARFPQKSGLMTHMMLHTGKPFKCDQCDKAFVSNHKLVHHLKSHDGDRPHVCAHCSSAFFTAAALNDHKSLHSRDRKHVCNKCNASFVHEVYLKIHLATHLLEADCENEMVGVDVASGNESPNASTSPRSNTGERSELTLTLDAIDQFCNGETIMMDLSA